MNHPTRTTPAAEESRLPSIAEWLQGEPCPWPGVDEPGEGARYAACYLVESKQLLRTKDDKPYLRLQLTDRSGTIEGRAWDDAERIDARVQVGAYVGVVGRIQSYRNQRQLKIEEIAPVHVADHELDLFLPASDLDLEALEAALDELIDSVADRPFRQLLLELAGPDTETGRAFRRAPAAKRNHHAYIGGLLEHTVSITRVADALARHYGDVVDRDLLITGAILHDIGKIQEISVTGGFAYTDPGKLLGHILLGLDLVRDAARRIPDLEPRRLLLLLHLIASHQGKYEWQSPRLPHTIEALLLHFADDIDAKVNHAIALVQSVEEGWTPYDNNFGREFLRHRNTVGAAAAAVDPLGPAAEEDGTESLLAEQIAAEAADAETVAAEGVEDALDLVERSAFDDWLAAAPTELNGADTDPWEAEPRPAHAPEPVEAASEDDEQSREPDPAAPPHDPAQVSIFDLL